MRKILAGTGAVWLVAGAALLAADFWIEKEFSAWSDREVEKMLTDSPWAKTATIVMGGLTPTGDFPVRLDPNGLGGNLPDPIPGRDCGGEQFQRIRRVKVTVTWTSALPIKLALVRRLIRLDAPIPPADQEMLTRDDPFYTVTLVGLPAPFAALEPLIDTVKAQTMLRRENRPPIAPTSVELIRNESDQSVLIQYTFPRTDPLTLDDAEVDFVTTLGATSEITKTFRLGDMLFGDQLAL